jgi:hypothetical protein
VAELAFLFDHVTAVRRAFRAPRFAELGGMGRYRCKPFCLSEGPGSRTVGRLLAGLAESVGLAILHVSKRKDRNVS